MQNTGIELYAFPSARPTSMATGITILHYNNTSTLIQIPLSLSDRHTT
jgi:hypothetical protein